MPKFINNIEYCREIGKNVSHLMYFEAPEGTDAFRLQEVRCDGTFACNKLEKNCELCKKYASKEVQNEFLKK